MSHYYGITVKRVKGLKEEITKDDYYLWMREANKVHKTLEFIERGFEKDGLGRLHVHIYARGPSKLYLKKLQQYGYTLDVIKLDTDDEKRMFLNYLSKDMFKEYCFKND